MKSFRVLAGMSDKPIKLRATCFSASLYINLRLKAIALQTMLVQNKSFIADTEYAWFDRPWHLERETLFVRYLFRAFVHAEKDHANEYGNDGEQLKPGRDVVQQKPGE